VLRDHLVLVCPACQESGDWTADLEHCAQCASVHLIRRLDQVECLDCGLVRVDPAILASVPTARDSRPDPDLADEVSRALDRLLGRA
jgi:hypothetical protein